MAHPLRTSHSSAPSVGGRNIDTNDFQDVYQQPAITGPAHRTPGPGLSSGFSPPPTAAIPLRISHSPVPSIVSYDGESHELHDFHERTTVPGPAESRQSLLGGASTNEAAPKPSFPLGLPFFSNHAQQIGKGGLFFVLTVLAAVMLVINLTQVAALERINSFVWIFAFPLVVFGLGVLIIAILSFASREHLMHDWKEAKPAARVAWIGIVIAILANIIICEFIYLPFFALKHWRHIDWTSNLEVSDNIEFPAVVIAWKNNVINMDLSDDKCLFTDTDHPKGRECSTSGVKSFQPDSKGQYLLFSPRDQSYEVTNSGLDGSNANLVLSMSMSYDSSIIDPDNSSFLARTPTFYVGVYDPDIHYDWSDFVNVCGNPPIYYCILPEVTSSISLAFHAENNRLDDKVGALVQERDATSNQSEKQLCSPDALKLTQYNYYTGRYDPFAGGDIMGSGCDLPYTYDPPIQLRDTSNVQRRDEYSEAPVPSLVSDVQSSTISDPASTSSGTFTQDTDLRSSISDSLSTTITSAPSSASSTPGIAPNGKAQVQFRACQVRIQIYMASSLVSTQTSSHGTDALKILTDEGGILGGIAFVMWFFSIFAV